MCVPVCCCGGSINLFNRANYFFIVSSPPPRYSKLPDSAQDSIELAGTPTHRRDIPELSAIVAPAELDAGEGFASDQTRRWTQGTVSSEATQPNGLGIRHLTSSARFSSQSGVSEVSSDNGSPNLQAETYSVSEISQYSPPSQSTSPLIHQSHRKLNSLSSKSPLSQQQ